MFADIVLHNVKCAKPLEKRLQDMIDVQDQSAILQGSSVQEGCPKNLPEAINTILTGMNMKPVRECSLKKKLAQAEEKNPENFEEFKKFIQATTGMNPG
jgi:hypothetical protein